MIYNVLEIIYIQCHHLSLFDTKERKYVPIQQLLVYDKEHLQQHLVLQSNLSK